MKGRRVLVVGASARAAAQSAAAAGLVVSAADLFLDADLRAVCQGRCRGLRPYPEALEEVVRASDADAWLYTGALENHPELLDTAARHKPLWGNAGAATRRARDPWLLAERLRAAGFLTPRLARLGANAPAGRWLRKPVASAGGAGVAWADTASTSNDSGETRALLAEYVAGQPLGLAYVAAGGKARLLGASRSLLAGAMLPERPFAHAGSISPFACSPPVWREARRLGDWLAGEFGLVGLFGVDVSLRRERLWVLEVNPRYTASMETLDRARGWNSLALHAWACQHGRRPPWAARNDRRPAATHGKAIVFARRSLVVEQPLSALSEASRRAERWELADEPTVGQSIARGAPVCTVLARGDGAAGARRRLAAAREAVWRFCERFPQPSDAATV